MRYLDSNIFIEFAQELLDSTREECSDYTRILAKSFKIPVFNWFPMLFYKTVKEYSSVYNYRLTTSKTCKVWKEIEKYIDENCKGPIKFSVMWDFCQFVRWSEKVVFYRNEKDSDIFVDSGLDDVDKRCFVINISDDVYIKFLLEKERISYNVSNTISDKPYATSIKIEVIRTYGKEMKNTYTIIDDKINFNDTSDLELMNIINNELERYMKETCINIYRKIYGYYTKDKIYPKFVEDKREHK